MIAPRRRASFHHVKPQRNGPRRSP